MGFQFSKIVEAHSFGGGIWLLWNASNIDIVVLSSSAQYLHVRVLWQNLQKLFYSTSDPSLLLGDFNTMIDPYEKSGGARFSHIPAREFRNCIHDCSLFDNGFTWAKFTWFRGNLKERIDRVLYIAEWLRVFQNAQTYHLKRIKSNHQPILADGDGRLATEEEMVRVELERTLWQEHMIWLQKSRLQWHKEGDRNTRFFHLSTIMRRKSNRIKGLKLSDGSWIYDDTEMQEVAVNHFKEFFAGGLVSPMRADSS
ncbi:hypothetical protein LINPERHAP2_LOCUS35307, partial [Linum perenne]